MTHSVFPAVFNIVIYAHAGRAPEPHDAWTAWHAEPVVIVGLVVAAWLYLRGVRRIWARAGTGRGVSRWRVRSWLAGLGAVAVALLSPVDAVAQSLFAVHMVQHLLLILVAAPLCVLGEPLVPMLFAFPQRQRAALGGWWRGSGPLAGAWHVLTQPVMAWTLHVAAMIAWHMPRLYDAAARSVPVHVLEHLSFFLTALLFWWVLVDRRRRHRMSAGVAVLYLFTAALSSTLLGAAITLARHPWYTAHWGTTAAWGLTPLEDQQLAGLIMWVPAGLVYLVALAPILVGVLRTGEGGSERQNKRLSS